MMGFRVPSRRDSALCRHDELDEFVDFRKRLVGLLDFGDGGLPREPIEEIGLDGGAECVARCLVHARTAESDDVRPLDLVPLEEAERRYVLRDAVAAADHLAIRNFTDSFSFGLNVLLGDYSFWR